MSEFMNDPVFVIAFGGILVICALLYAVECIRWSYEMERKCREAQKWLSVKGGHTHDS